jgi:type I restriction enzyme R subunit
MSNTAKEASERAFQENLVNELKKYSWSAPESLNGSTHKVTVETLIENWRNELNRINKQVLEGVKLTDNEFAQVLSKVNQINNSYEAAKILAAENGKGKIDGIWRDDDPNVTKKQITLTIFKKAQVVGGDSSYQIAREVSTNHNNRFDIVLLFYGLPLINIELKRADKTIDEAFGQFKRYYKDGEYTNNFMAFSQMMVICSEIDTEYFATPKSLSDFNRAFCFHWSDKENNIITDWREIASTLLRIPMAHQLVGDYLVINESDKEDERCTMVMRPYQVYALQAIELAAKGNDGKCGGFQHGGYVWHTTGSGKTLTSFKTALFLSLRTNIDKVVFLVDRRELDANTTARFKAYAAYESVTVDETLFTYQLRKKLTAPHNGIVVTTTFKLNNLVKDLIEAKDYSLAEKKMVFIIDEAHRTTMGEMMARIKEYFKINGLFFGFTGTPLFDENHAKGMINKKSELIDTTEKLFGPILHKYTIDEAIRDSNVLGFHVDYINTGEFSSYEDLRDQLTERLKLEHPEQNIRDIERKVQALSELNLETECKEKGILIYQDETHIPRVVEEILSGWEQQSQGRFFNAILTTAYIGRAAMYAEEFEKQQEGVENPIHVALTVSFGNENNVDSEARKKMERIFAYYFGFTGIKFIPGDQKHGEKQYFEDLISRAARGGSGRNDKNIDLVIVADQMLTGYDSKYLNTLYVDRPLELQSLIQAYSRTNRVYGPAKEFGTIINFQYPRITEAAVDKALELYGSGGSNSIAIVDTYETAVRKLRAFIADLRTELSDPTAWIKIKDDEEAKKSFNKAFLAAFNQMNIVRQYYEYKWDDEAFGIDDHTWKEYIGAYKNLNPGGIVPPAPVRPLRGRTKLVGTQEVTAGYIIGLIGEKNSAGGETTSLDDESLRLILERIQELSNLGEAEQAKLLEEFVDDIKEGRIAPFISADEAYRKWKDEKLMHEINAFAEEWGADPDLLRTSLDSYSTREPDTVPRLDEIIDTVDISKVKKEVTVPLLHNIELSNTLPKWLAEVRRKYFD